MWQNPSAREESMTEWVSTEIRDSGCVDIGESEKPPRKVGRIFIRSKDGPEARIEMNFKNMPEMGKKSN